MKVIEGNYFVYFDVDDTLVSWDTNFINQFPELTVEFNCYGETHHLIPINETINYLIKAKKSKATVIVWSAGGWEWAQEVIKKLELEDYVDCILSKPSRYLDDLSCSEFMGIRDNKLPKFEKRMRQMIKDKEME